MQVEFTGITSRDHSKIVDGMALVHCRHVGRIVEQTLDMDNVATMVLLALQHSAEGVGHGVETLGAALSRQFSKRVGCVGFKQADSVVLKIRNNERLQLLH